MSGSASTKSMSPGLLRGSGTQFSFGSDAHGARIAFVCPTHGIQALVDPFDHLR